MSAMRKNRLVWIVLLLVGFGLRLYQLDQFGFWQDEGLTPLRANYSVREILSNHVIIQEVVTNDTVPPFYFLLTYFSRQLWGESDFAYRFLPALFGVLTLPLIFQLGRRLGGAGVGLVGMGLLAINPLHIWYGQEARMYTLATWLMLAASLALWQALARPDKKIIQPFILYLLFAGIAFATHYLSAFLIVGQGALWLWLLWRRGQKKWIVGGTIAGILVILPFASVTIPRLFTGAETNYFYVPPWQIAQDLAHGYTVGVSLNLRQWWVGWLDAGVAGIALVGVWAAKAGKKRDSQLFLLIYLLAIPVGVSLIAPLKPMYQGVRHIFIGSPPYYLLIGLGVWTIWQKWGGLPAFLALILPIFGAFYSLNQLYHNPMLAKDDTRALIRYVETHAGENDAVVYNDAISLPTHAHYAHRADVPAFALPQYPHPFSDQTEQQLSELANQYDRIWFMVGPPADKRDDEEAVRQWLNQNLTQVDSYSAHGVTHEVRVDAFSAGERGEPVATNVQWQKMPLLEMVRTQFSQPTRSPALWFDLSWRASANATPPPDTQMGLQMQDEAGVVWATANHSFWMEEQSHRRQLFLPLPAGIPPGAYALFLQAWQKESGESLGDWQPIGEALIAPADGQVMTNLPQMPACSPQWENGLQLRAFIPSDTVKPGHTLPVSLYWSGVSSANLRYRVELWDEAGEMLRADEGAVMPAWSSRGEADDIVLGNAGFYIYPETAPGKYRLRWQIFDGDQPVAGKRCWQLGTQTTIEFGEIEAVAWEMNTELPAVTDPMQAVFGKTIELYAAKTAPSDGLTVTLYWRAVAQPSENYKVFLHLKDENGAIIDQIDRIPLDGLRPTGTWRAGEVLTEKYTVEMPATAGNYSIFIGFYDPETYERLPVTLNGQLQSDNQLLVEQVAVE